MILCLPIRYKIKINDNSLRVFFLSVIKKKTSSDFTMTTRNYVFKDMNI